MANDQKKGGATRAPQITYQYVGPDCNAIVLPDNTKVTPGTLSSAEIIALLAQWPCVREYWIVAEDNPS